MKLQTLLLTSVMTMTGFAAFAADNNELANGGTYVGLAAGWGAIPQVPDVFSWIFAARPGSTQSGGFSGRVYLGYLMSLNADNSWLFGPELGYSSYANNSYNARVVFFSDLGNINIKQSAYGADLLINATYLLSNRLNIAVKPGFQYAFEKNTLDFPGADYYRSASDTRVLPEINLETNWQVFQNTPFFLGISYQYVWGSIEDYTNFKYNNAETTSREMIALNLEYLFA